MPLHGTVDPVGNLVENVRDQAASTPEQTAMGFGDDAWMYEELVGAIDAFAGGLGQAGYQAPRVAIYLPNLPQFVFAYHGTP
jgi:long-chain acyl-CoA synthetase